jgi:hypothetical protein
MYFNIKFHICAYNASLCASNNVDFAQSPCCLLSTYNHNNETGYFFKTLWHLRSLQGVICSVTNPVESVE